MLASPFGLIQADKPNNVDSDLPSNYGRMELTESDSFAFASESDSVIIKTVYENPVWVYPNDSIFKVDILINTGVDIYASSCTFEPMRNLFRIDSLTWGDTMQAAIWESVDNPGRGILPMVYIENDKIVGSDIRSYITPGFVPILAPYGPAIRVTEGYILMATVYITFKSDSLDAIQNPIDFYVDSTFVPPALNWEMTNSDGASIVPSFETDTIVLKYAPNCGDANSDGIANISDAVWILNYIFDGGPPPDPLESAEINCDDIVNISDVVWLLNYIFLEGPAPCECRSGFPEIPG
jgi:hypothetical protein